MTTSKRQAQVAGVWALTLLAITVFSAFTIETAWLGVFIGFVGGALFAAAVADTEYREESTGITPNSVGYTGDSDDED